MIRVLYGSQGSGKTKQLLDYTNEAIKVESGEIVFIDDDKRYMFDLRHEVRFIDIHEYSYLKGCSPRELLCFLSGMLAVNYDICLVAVDSFLKIVKAELDSDEMKDFFDKLDQLSEAHHCRFVFSVNAEKVPEYMNAFTAL